MTLLQLLRRQDGLVRHDQARRLGLSHLADVVRRALASSSAA